ncbi:hypothetical protein KFU94_08320 [Chloroflexi bacterium TSY]|nr:hypothetical protein [Chloroflexi bacterium TSY]
MWQIEFSQEASNYAIDSHPYNEDVLIAIEKLAFTEDGFPEDGSYQTLEQWCVWEILDHVVVYERVNQVLYIYIWMIKPG